MDTHEELTKNSLTANSELNFSGWLLTEKPELTSLADCFPRTDSWTQCLLLYIASSPTVYRTCPIKASNNPLYSNSIPPIVVEGFPLYRTGAILLLSTDPNVAGETCLANPLRRSGFQAARLTICLEMFLIHMRSTIYTVRNTDSEFRIHLV
jgi:hypothetical protein